MILVNTNELLETHLNRIYDTCKTVPPDEFTREKQAYAQGIKDALALVTLHKAQSADPGLAKPCAGAFEPEQPALKRLYEMTLEEISKLNLVDITCPENEHYTREELVEAAFKFENEFIECLGDVNWIPLDAYTGLSRGQLFKIITNSVADICRTKNG